MRTCGSFCGVCSWAIVRSKDASGDFSVYPNIIYASLSWHTLSYFLKFGVCEFQSSVLLLEHLPGASTWKEIVE